METSWAACGTALALCQGLRLKLEESDCRQLFEEARKPHPGASCDAPAPCRPSFAPIPPTPKQFTAWELKNILRKIQTHLGFSHSICPLHVCFVDFKFLSIGPSSNGQKTINAPWGWSSWRYLKIIKNLFQGLCRMVSKIISRPCHHQHNFNILKKNDIYSTMVDVVNTISK